jgi:hypothetical protein
MNKKEYFEQPFVADFRDWFADRLEATELAHAWEERSSRQEIQFQNIYDAYDKYSWSYSLRLPDQPPCSGSSFDDNHRALTVLRTGLRNVVTGRLDGETLIWTQAVLRWGGRVCTKRLMAGGA